MSEESQSFFFQNFMVLKNLQFFKKNISYKSFVTKKILMGQSKIVFFLFTFFGDFFFNMHISKVHTQFQVIIPMSDV
jgi:hypothetical protein